MKKKSTGMTKPQSAARQQKGSISVRLMYLTITKQINTASIMSCACIIFSTHLYIFYCPEEHEYNYLSQTKCNVSHETLVMLMKALSGVCKGTCKIDQIIPDKSNKIHRTIYSMWYSKNFDMCVFPADVLTIYWRMHCTQAEQSHPGINYSFQY